MEEVVLPVVGKQLVIISVLVPSTSEVVEETMAAVVEETMAAVDLSVLFVSVLTVEECVSGVEEIVLESTIGLSVYLDDVADAAVVL